MTQSNDITDHVNGVKLPDSPSLESDSKSDEGFSGWPTPEWQQLGEHKWRHSDLSDHLYQAMIDVGDGIELCVEAGGNPNNPPLLMIMGLGSQMIFWPDNFVKRLIDEGFL